MSNALRIKVMKNIDTHFINKNKSIDDKIDAMFQKLEKRVNKHDPIQLPFEIIMTILKMRHRDSNMSSPTAALVKASLTSDDCFKFDFDRGKWCIKYATNFWIARTVILMNWHCVDFMAKLGYGQYYTILDNDLFNILQKKAQ